ncbi:hypothetical protein COT48_03360 [Candidatus Woesearchaeota archaeon CG08_land_8_20_14_0_20_47_9]|nr:MAG: hypothetical protein AUJ69_03275 [Candidatus Woesearchaeota archaeon CG1_02_47_18]PIO03806.1 MAG: hypothetical protein COT48_03360 [Candidatus Woesearchaeota archaeon CG08_land_8_20_14_0_20_47_9]HII29863.1 hypothetical protein [Candidatus Woesearchaeota archaeon]
MTKGSAPVFVKLENYNEVMKITESLKSRITEAKAILAKVDAILSEEQKNLDNWKTELDSVEKKVNALSDALLKPEAQ